MRATQRTAGAIGWLDCAPPPDLRADRTTPAAAHRSPVRTYISILLCVRHEARYQRGNPIPKETTERPATLRHAEAEAMIGRRFGCRWERRCQTIPATSAECPPVSPCVCIRHSPFAIVYSAGA